MNGVDGHAAPPAGPLLQLAAVAQPEPNQAPIRVIPKNKTFSFEGPARIATILPFDDSRLHCDFEFILGDSWSKDEFFSDCDSPNRDSS